MLLQKIIIEDIFNLLLCIHLKFNIPLNLLLKRYIPNFKIITKIKRKRTKLPRKSTYKFNDIARCMARCWGGEKSVKYNMADKKWTYGYRCKRHKYGLNNYCITHLKQAKKNGHPGHGDYNTTPPHLHYYKYKNKIEKRFKIKN
jgi:hypothetical protein